jgi:hypothetical protein
MIVKCQLSLSSNEPESQLLFYNEARDWIGQYPVSLGEDWLPRFGTDLEGHRFFAEVRWQDRYAPPAFVRKLPEQGW